MVRTLRRSLAVATALVALALVAPVALAADHGVDIAGFAFSPQSVTVAVGDSVTWTNADAQGHTATADDASFDTGTISNGSSKSVTFSTAGTFAYHCKIHPQMTATVVVGAAAGSAPPTDTAIPSDSARPSAEWTWLALLGAALGGIVLARRRFAPRSARR